MRAAPTAAACVAALVAVLLPDPSRENPTPLYDYEVVARSGEPGTELPWAIARSCPTRTSMSSRAARSRSTTSTRADSGVSTHADGTPPSIACVARTSAGNGVAVTLEINPEMIHGFHGLSDMVPEGRASLARAAEFVGRHKA